MITTRILPTFILGLTVLVMAAGDASGYALIKGYNITMEESSYLDRVTIGEEVHETHETSHPYPGTGIVWEHKFTWKNAGYISIHFAEFDLAPGDFVEITSPDGEYGYIYQGQGKVVRGGEATLSEFWASHIPGESAIVRLYGTDSGPAFGFTIDKWVHGFEKEVIDEILGAGYRGDTDAICGNDDKEWAPCYEGTEIYEKARAVARLMIGGSSACTGWLLGSEGHLITNHHCIGTQWEADNTDYEFMAEGETCETDCYGWGACPGIVAAASGELIKTDYDLDYTLILLESNPTPEYGYLQLREELPEVGESMYIVQHPGAYGKQIATYDDQSGGDCNVYSLSEPPCIGGPGDIGYMCDTEGGSSGSPVDRLERSFSYRTASLRELAPTGDCRFLLSLSTVGGDPSPGCHRRQGRDSRSGEKLDDRRRDGLGPGGGSRSLQVRLHRRVWFLHDEGRFPRERPDCRGLHRLRSRHRVGPGDPGRGYLPQHLDGCG